MPWNQRVHSAQFLSQSCLTNVGVDCLTSTVGAGGTERPRDLVLDRPDWFSVCDWSPAAVLSLNIPDAWLSACVIPTNLNLAREWEWILLLILAISWHWAANRMITQNHSVPLMRLLNVICCLDWLPFSPAELEFLATHTTYPDHVWAHHTLNIMHWSEKILSLLLTRSLLLPSSSPREKGKIG